ncbi:NUDIX domain-containing protein [Krasilnikovia sp. MM14-A1259]|uniref:NUDIX domain-containing protein n=1 Tax=Krasilnikovia sp. MM14-A1259 TaxID=3373539 RepID=UPI003815BDB5
MGLTWAESYLGRVRASVGDADTLLFVGARGVILDDANRLLLIQRSDNQRWAIPAGAMELGESMQDCAVREVWEETGLRATALTPFAFYSGYTFTNGYGHTYQQILMSFRIHAWEGELQTVTDESVDAGFFPLDALPGPRSFIIDETLADLAAFERTGTMVLK